MTPQERFDRAVHLALQTLRFSASERARIRDAIAAMTTLVVKRIALENIAGMNKRELNKLVKAVDAIIDKGMTDAWDDEAYAHFWQLMSIQSAKSIDPEADEEDFPLVPLGLIGGLLMVGGISVLAWRKRTLDTIKFRIGGAIRQGAANGETASQIITRIVGTQAAQRMRRITVAGKPVAVAVKPTASATAPTFSPGLTARIARESDALTNTLLQAILSQARLSAFRKYKNQLRGIRQISVLDDRTTTTCIAYSNAEWTLDLVPIPPTTLPYNSGTPRHFNCRSQIVEIMRNDDKVVQQSFAVWLARQPMSYQDSVLGRGRAQLWRDGKITLSQLVSGDGNPLTLAQLRAIYA